MTSRGAVSQNFYFAVDKATYKLESGGSGHGTTTDEVSEGGLLAAHHVEASESRSC